MILEGGLLVYFHCRYLLAESLSSVRSIIPIDVGVENESYMAEAVVVIRSCEMS